jgi:hypothetical protein
LLVRAVKTVRSMRELVAKPFGAGDPLPPFAPADFTRRPGAPTADVVDTALVLVVSMP